MLDAATGELVLPTTGVRLGPAWTRTLFLKSRLGAAAMPGTINWPWSRYALEFPPGEVGPFAAVVTLQFRKEALVWLEVMDVSPEFGTSWDDWSEEKEHARRAAHDRWLEASGAPAGQYTWARVWSNYDSKGGLSSITICYDQAIHR